MDVLYDTRTIHPLDRYDYFRAGAGIELAPLAVQGRASSRLLAVMSVAQIGDFEIEVLAWSADSEIATRRTERLIRACDPECYRIFLSVSGAIRLEQAGNQVNVRARDIALHDLSRLSQATPSPGSMRLVMLTFPRALVPIASASIRPLIGTLIPRSMPGRSLIAQFLIGLTGTAELTADPDLAQVLYECTVGLICQRLGQPNGITPYTRQLLHRARIRDILRRHLGNPLLDPNRIADAANISPRYLHQLFQCAELTPHATTQTATPTGMPPSSARSGASHGTHQGPHRHARLPPPGPVRPRLQTPLRRLANTDPPTRQPTADRA
jgi:hypothetical protein